MQKFSVGGSGTLPLEEGTPVTSLLTIAGFDPSSGAGFTADLKVFAAHRMYGVACPTAWTVQSTQGVLRSEPVDAGLLAEMLDCLHADIRIGGVKIGMLANGAVVGTVARWLRRFRGEAPEVPVVLDPVARSSSGHTLLSPEGLERMQNELLPLVSVLTPNLAEATLLTGLAAATREEAQAAGRALQRAVRGGRGAVVVTGGHFAGAPDDLLCEPGGIETWVPGFRVHTNATHGTGCAFSSALLCAMVRGPAMPEAVRSAKDYVGGALLHAYAVGKGRGPMHHLFECFEANPPEHRDRTEWKAVKESGSI